MGQQDRRRISSLCCEDGTITTDEFRIKFEILRFYEALLGVEDSSCTGGCGGAEITVSIEAQT